jgi:hypothetical protein
MTTGPLGISAMQCSPCSFSGGWSRARSWRRGGLLDHAANPTERQSRPGLPPAGRRNGVRTGGAGDGTAHLGSQGSVVLTGDGEHLLVTNARSGDVSVLSLGS